jgi:hypothetical protein
MIDWWVYPIIVGICVVIIFWKEINSMFNPKIESWLYKNVDNTELTKSYIDDFAPIIEKTDTKEPTQKTIKLFKCSQCGSILKSSVCEYCGAKYGTITDLKPVPVQTKWRVSSENPNIMEK